MTNPNLIDLSSRAFRSDDFDHSHPAPEIPGVPTLPLFLREFAVPHESYRTLNFGNGSEYPIDYSRMDTAEKVVEWVRHLTEKPSVTTMHIAAFVNVAIQLGAETEDV